ncbi:MAG: UvrD-helicase domain-containing protein [Pelosinus sp.]|nr:UvrD-helicase domain-containing protein [Pelosinus sp.]
MLEQHPDFEAETQHLAATITKMKQLMEDLNADIDERFNSMQKSLSMKDEVSAYVHAMMRGDNAKKIHDIDGALDNPYFGRVDFREDNTEDFHSFYIGRCKIAQINIQDLEDILVFDWRDPISTVFYECYAGRASYDVLGRYHYSGDVKLKRQYKIEDGVLKTIVDNYILDQVLSRQQEAILADPLLVERLKQGAADKLKDIVTSIQTEQNKIIREPLNQVTVIQGVAGSGKSTIGLHRLSYLLYAEKLNPKKLIVIAPNRIFLDYISELLPEIDAADVQQMVWEDVVAMITKEKYTIKEDRRLDLIMAGQDKQQIRLVEDTARLKGSLDFMPIMDAYIERKTQKVCRKLEDIVLFDGKLVIQAKEQLENFMANAKTPYNERLRTLTGYITFRVNNYLDILKARRHRKGGLEDTEIKKVQQAAEAFLQKYLKRWPSLELLEAYGQVFADKIIFKIVKDKNFDVDALREYSIILLKTGQVEREDLAPLAYLYFLLNGWRHITKFDHIVIDEAQDLNALEFAIIKRLSSNGSFTIMGDLSQGIHSYRSISSWNVVLKEIFADARSVYREIKYSYRSAKEIIDVFNRVMPQGHTKAIPVYEIGHKPTLEKISSPSQGIIQAASMLRIFLSRGAKSIGIITKLEEDAVWVHEQLTSAVKLAKIDQPIHLIINQASKYQGGITVLPVSLAKGLEFDGVILWNASETEFKATPFDARLLYVALSRAMHNLHIMYQGNLTPLLRKKQ